MTDARSEKFVLKTLPGYFFKNQELTSLVTANAGTALVEKLKKILPRLNLSTKKFNASAGLYICDHFKAAVVTQGEILALTQKVIEGGIIFVVSHRDWGVKRTVANLVTAFGEENVEILERGMAGYRLIGIRSARAVPQEAIPETTLTVDFSIKTPTGKNIDLTLKSDLSLFSAKALDEGTRLLLETVDFSQYRRILEIGCGWGALGITALVVNPKLKVMMTDIEPRAVAVVEQNLAEMKLDDRGQVLLTSAPETLDGTFDLIISNPPYHTDNKKLTSLFTQAKSKLAFNGQIIIGTDQTYLPKFQKILEGLDFKVTPLAAKGRYRVLAARV